MELKLYLYIEPSGIDNWYCYETFNEFYNAIIDEWYQSCFEEEEFNTREKVEKYIKECPYIKLYEIRSDAPLDIFIDDDKEKTETILASDLIKKYDKGYIGDELVEFSSLYY